MIITIFHNSPIYYEWVEVNVLLHIRLRTSNPGITGGVMAGYFFHNPRGPLDPSKTLVPITITHTHTQIQLYLVATRLNSRHVVPMDLS